MEWRWSWELSWSLAIYSEGRASDLVRSYDNMKKVILLPDTFLTSQVVYESPKNDNFRSIELVRTFWRYSMGFDAVISKSWDSFVILMSLAFI